MTFCQRETESAGCCCSLSRFFPWVFQIFSSVQHHPFSWHIWASNFPFPLLHIQILFSPILQKAVIIKWLYHFFRQPDSVSKWSSTMVQLYLRRLAHMLSREYIFFGIWKCPFSQVLHMCKVIRQSDGFLQESKKMCCMHSDYFLA